MEAQSPEPVTQPPKFSRYRSVRRAAAQNEQSICAPEPAPAPPSVKVTAGPQISRVPSRYRRLKTQHTHSVPLPSTRDDQPVGGTPPEEPHHLTSPPKRHHTTVRHQDTSRPTHDACDVASTRSHEKSQGNSETRKILRKRSQTFTNGAPTNDTSKRDTTIRRSHEIAREEARLILEGELDRLQKFREQCRRQARSERHATRPAPSAETTAQTAALPLHKQRQYVDQPNLSRKVTVKSQRPRKATNEDNGDAGNSQSPRGQRGSPTSQDLNSTNEVGGTRKGNDVPMTAVALAPAISSIAAVTAAGTRGIVSSGRQFDAPVSAVNAGERRVEIRHDEVSVTLPVTPTTTAQDLINSASLCMAKSMDPRTSVLVETFSQLGLERPVRRYEHVRDVMNSWNHDKQNRFLIMAEATCDAQGLELEDVPAEQPPMVMLQMQHSQKPGRWEKRWIILRADGQVTASKHENDGNAANIFHLSDFDVYTPTRKQMKRLKPPKKICFAVKSQQKSAMFLETTNFIHFFSTNDRGVADQWYHAVQSWRSWYLVHVLGEGQSKKVPAGVGTTTATSGGVLGPPTSVASRESVPYQLGSSQPLSGLSIADVQVSHSDTNEGTERVSSDVRRTSTSAPRPLVDFATSRQSIDQAPVGQRSQHSPRRHSRHRDGMTPDFRRRGNAEEEEEAVVLGSGTDQAFTGGGLLARSASRRVQGGQQPGHGIPSARGKPLVDLASSNTFTDGSLLRQVEAWSVSQAATEPKVDRQKYVEAKIRVGEGVC